MLSLPKLNILALVAFVSVSIGKPLDPRLQPGWTLLGYRTVTQVEANSINQEGTIFHHDSFNQKQQLGNGKSLSGIAGQWTVGTNNWYCYVAVQTSDLQSLKKVWIPETYWFNGEESIRQYITGKGLPVKETLRFAKVYGSAPAFNEVFVSSEMLKADEYQMWAQCYNSLIALQAGMIADDLVTPGIVEYTTTTFAGPAS